MRDVRARIKELANRGYADPATTAGYVLLFIPNESVYAFIQEHDREVGDVALRQGVVLCSPFTLFAVLGVVRQAADAVALQRGADEVLDVLAGFAKQWDQFTERLEAVGKSLSTVQNAYEQVNGPRRRQLERQLDKVEDVRRRRGLGGDVEAEQPTLREVSAW